MACTGRRWAGVVVQRVGPGHAGAAAQRVAGPITQEREPQRGTCRRQQRQSNLSQQVSLNKSSRVKGRASAQRGMAGSEQTPQGMAGRTWDRPRGKQPALRRPSAVAWLMLARPCRVQLPQRPCRAQLPQHALPAEERAGRPEGGGSRFWCRCHRWQTRPCSLLCGKMCPGCLHEKGVMVEKGRETARTSSTCAIHHHRVTQTCCCKVTECVGGSWAGVASLGMPPATVPRTRIAAGQQYRLSLEVWGERHGRCQHRAQDR